MFANKEFFAVYECEHQQCLHKEYRSIRLKQWPSHAESALTIDLIGSEIDAKAWSLNKSLHISYVERIANNNLEIGEKKYDALADIELNVSTFQKMLDYSAASLEVVELFLPNKNHTIKTDHFYSVIFDEFRFKLKGSLDIEYILNVLMENSKQIKKLSIQIVDEKYAMMDSFIKSRERLESLKLYGCNVDVNFIFDNSMKSALKDFSLDYGKFNAKTPASNSNQLESLNLNSGIDDLGQWVCLESLQKLTLKLCFLSGADFQFLKWCKQLKSVTLDHCYDAEDNKIIGGFLDLPAIVKFVLVRTFFQALSPCSTLKVLHLKPTDWHLHNEVMTQVFEQMPNLRYLKVLQSTQYTEYFTIQTYNLMKSVLANSDLTFVMYRKTYDNYREGDIVVVEKDPSKQDSVDFEFEKTFFLDFFPNYDVFGPFQEALQKDGLDYHIKFLTYNKYHYEEVNI